MRFPIGIDHLVVNGVVTVRDGEHTGAMAGRVLRRA
jgi:N-acyl-D-aspartate/D-glutamate deacylase